MEREKPDALVRVNDYNIAVYRRGRGVEITLEKDGQEVGFFGLSGTPLGNQQEAPPVSALSPASEPQRNETPVAASPAPTSEGKKEPSQPVKLVGTVEAIEGMGQTPTTGDPVFRFSIKTEQEEIKQIAAFREIGRTLYELTQSSDPHIKLMPGREISMMAWDHTEKTGSYYPSSVNYLNLPPILNPKMQKRR